MFVGYVWGFAGYGVDLVLISACFFGLVCWVIVVGWLCTLLDVVL